MSSRRSPSTLKTQWSSGIASTVARAAAPADEAARSRQHGPGRLADVAGPGLPVRMSACSFELFCAPRP